MIAKLPVLGAMGLLFAGMIYAADAAPVAGAPAVQTEQTTGPQPFKNYGFVLINVENPKEASLLIQIMIPGKDGKTTPEQFGITIKQDATGTKLIQEFGVKSAKPDDAEGAKKTQQEALQKFVMVEGVLDVTAEGDPILTVSKYEKTKIPVADAEPAK